MPNASCGSPKLKWLLRRCRGPGGPRMAGLILPTLLGVIVPLAGAYWLLFH